MKSIAVIGSVVMFSSAALSANAQTSTAMQDPERLKVAERCLVDAREGRLDEAEQGLQVIEAWRADLDFATVGKATVCFNLVRGDGWKYLPKEGRFADPASVAAVEAAEKLEAELAAADARDRQRAINDQMERARNAEVAREEALEARRQAARDATSVACGQLYQLDQVAALTNPVCSPIFLSQGLPD